MTVMKLGVEGQNEQGVGVGLMSDESHVFSERRRHDIVLPWSCSALKLNNLSKESKNLTVSIQNLS